MNYVENFNFYGVEAMQIPCIKGSGAPTAATPGAVGCLYMDTTTAFVYKCVDARSTSRTWWLLNQSPILNAHIEEADGSFMLSSINGSFDDILNYLTINPHAPLVFMLMAEELTLYLPLSYINYDKGDITSFVFANSELLLTVHRRDGVSVIPLVN